MSEVSPDYSALRFLVADDKAFIRTIVRGMLLRLNVKDVVQAPNGQQGLNLLQKYGKRIDCVISDWNMHPIGGLELLRSIRCGEVQGFPATACFIMLTGHGADNVVKAARALDVNAYIIKPVSFEKLQRTIGSAMEREIKPKSPAQYHAVGDISIPAAVKAAEAHLPPWVLGISKSPRRAQLEEHIQQIRRDAASLKHEDDDVEVPELTNTRCLDLHEIAPGAVLAEDLYANDRALLIAAGTRLSAALLASMKKLVESDSEEVKLWVGDQAKSSPA
jgi:two-component system chemotaxis response regulator CheY